LQDYGFGIYNPGLGKFLSVDPITADYPELTPFQFASNTPIAAVDMDGLESAVVIIPRGVNITERDKDDLRRAMSFQTPASRKILSASLDFSQVGTLKGLTEAVSGKDLVTGEKLTWWERGLNLLPLVGGLRKAKALNAIDDLKDANKTINAASDARTTVSTLTTASDVTVSASNVSATAAKVYKSAKLNAIAANMEMI